MPKLFDMWRGAKYSELGEVPLQSGNAALLSAVENWMLSPRGTVIRGKETCGILYRYMGNKYLTEETCARLRNDLAAGLKYDFDPPLEIDFLEVIPDYQKRAIVIYGKVFTSYYNAEADINMTIEQG